MNSRERIEKAKDILSEIPEPTLADIRVLKLIRIVTQLVLVCENQQVEINDLRNESGHSSSEPRTERRNDAK